MKATMIRLLLLLAGLVALVYSEGYEDVHEGYGDVHEHEEPTTTERPKRKCYQCSYSPDRTVYEEIEVVRKVHDHETGRYRKVTEKKTVPVKKKGGWGKCGGNFTGYDAVRFGIDTWECDHNCFVRVDKSNNLFRGCYRGEFGVDPDNTDSIQVIGDSKYKFCAGRLCNNYDLKY